MANPLLSRPDFIARFGDNAPAVAATIEDYIDKSGELMMQLGSDLAAIDPLDPPSVPEIVSWLALFGGSAGDVDEIRQIMGIANAGIDEGLEDRPC